MFDVVGSSHTIFEFFLLYVKQLILLNQGKRRTDTIVHVVNLVITETYRNDKRGIPLPTSITKPSSLTAIL